MSLPEILLWTRIKTRKSERPAFRRQHPYAPYVFDFYCPQIKLIVEIDGVEHYLDNRPERDKSRDIYLRNQGFEIWRIDAVEVLKDPDYVAERIWELVAKRMADDRGK